MQPQPTYHRNKGFKFGPFWIKYEECYCFIFRMWIEKVTDKFDLSTRLHRWQKIFDPKVQISLGSFEKIRDLQTIIEKLNQKQYKIRVMNRIKNLEIELHNLLMDEENYCRQRSRSDWMRTGDKNSSYVHGKVSGRRRKNEVSYIYDSGDIKCDDQNILSSNSIQTTFHH